MKKGLFLIGLTILSFHLFAREVTVEKAREVAVQFLQRGNTQMKSASTYDLVYLGDVTAKKVNMPSKQKSAKIENPEVYFFGLTDTVGFIIISADDATVPVLGYSPNGKVRANNLPANFQKWMEGYRQQIKYIRANSVVSSSEIAALWNGTAFRQKTSGQSVSPLLSTQWDQAPYVNARCPYDNEYRELTVTGCPATAMAQIMRYWKYPEKGIGFHSYQHEKYGTLSANFGATTYNWDAMPNVVNSANDAVALLMYHCGVAVEMGYNVAEEGGSGSYVIIDPYNRYSETQTVEYALKTYFGYDSSLKGLERDDYTDSEWQNILKTELNAGRPVQYAGYGQGGHTFVCDGYDNNNYFHMNWGWGGYYDGFFYLDALNPGSGGIGAGGASYNDGQQALIGIKPLSSSSPENPTQLFNLELYDDVTASSSSITFGDAFTIHTDIVNTGSTDFAGDYCAAIFDMNDAFIDFVEIISGASLKSNYHYTNGVTFSSEGTIAMLPGSYRIYIFARPTDGDWVCLNADPTDLYTQSYAEMDVTYENDISLYSTIDVLTTEVYTGGPFSVHLDIANYSYWNFSGLFDVSLYDLNGDFVCTVEEMDNMTLNSNNHYINGLTFSTNSLNVEPGTYLLALMHKWSGYDYELTGSTSQYFNPIKVIVQGEPIYADKYEDNDSYSDAYPLNLNFSGNQCRVKTTGSNIHVGSDWDFYSLNLEAGYGYTINARLHDAWSSSDGNTYSVDGLFLYSTDGENWSDVFDDVMPADIYVNGGRQVCFVVSPYFLGEKGTYLLDISLERGAPNAVDSYSDDASVSAFPNPVVDWVKLRSTSSLRSCQLYNLQGKMLNEFSLSGTSSQLNLSSLEKGVYFLKVFSDDKVSTLKLIKQ